MTISNDSVATKVAKAAELLAAKHRTKLDELKAKYADCSRHDFLWHYLLQSFATMGGSTGWAGLIGNPANYARVRFDVLESLAGPDREREVLKVCRGAKLRWPERKAGFILSAFEKVRDLGGLPAANTRLFGAQGREAKMKFLKSFTGIGDKYARNMMMDVYHDDFRDSIAIDSRIKGLSTTWGLSFASYEEHEHYYLDVAAAAELNGWELDRLLYNFHDEFLSLVRMPLPSSPRGARARPDVSSGLSPVAPGAMESAVAYSIAQHKHRFSAWAAGRAASVKNCRFSVEQAKLIIEAVGLDRCLVDPKELPLPSDIDEAHANWRSKVIAQAARRFGLVLTHGIAAKLINVYLKAAFVCGGHHAHERVQALHPPIDALLLAELARCELGGQKVAWQKARRLRWSKLNSQQYQEVIDAIRAAMPAQPLWHVEQYWRGHQ